MLHSGLVVAAFPAFSAEHWAALGSVAGVAAVLSWLVRGCHAHRAEQIIRRTVCWSLSAVLLTGAAAAEVGRILAGSWSLQESLPLHLCDIAALVVAAALLGAGLHGGKNPGRIWQRLYELGYVWGIGGTSQALLTPDLQATFPSAACLGYFTLHGGIIVGVLVMTVGLRLRPQPGTPRRVWLTTFLLALVVMAIDWLTGANYMYLRGPPANPTLYDYFGPWPWSLLALAAVATALIYLCYSPFWMLDRRARRRPSA